MSARPDPGRFDTEALRERHPVAELAERYGLALRGQGEQRYALCPFHVEREPSLVIRPRRNRFTCYGCGANGDSIDFVRLMEGVDFVGACELLGGDRLGPARPGRHQQARTAAPIPEDLPAGVLATLRAAAEIYHAALPRSARAVAYFRERGITADAVRLAGVGYCTGRDLGPGLAARGLDPRWARQTGLLDERGRERLRGRVTVPVTVGRQVVTMTGRAVVPSLKRRYLDLPLPPHLLGGDLVGGARWRRVVLVEGVVDYLVALGWGLPTISPMGTHAAKHVRAEARDASAGASLVVLALDNDEAGRRAGDAWSAWLGPTAALIAWPPDVGDVGDLGPRPDGRARFLALLADAERCQQRAEQQLRRAS